MDEMGYKVFLSALIGYGSVNRGSNRSRKAGRYTNCTIDGSALHSVYEANAHEGWARVYAYNDDGTLAGGQRAEVRGRIRLTREPRLRQRITAGWAVVLGRDRLCWLVRGDAATEMLGAQRPGMRRASARIFATDRPGRVCGVGASNV